MRITMLRTTILLLTVAVFAYVWLGTSAETDTSSQNGILWEISKEGVEPSYLLGTMHTEDPRVTENIPEPILDALERSDSFSGELDMSFSNLMAAQSAMFLEKGTHLKDIIGEERFHKCAQILRDWG